MSQPLKLAHPVCATCKGTGRVQRRDGTSSPCLPCELDRRESAKKRNAAGAEATGPGGADRKVTQ